MNINLVRRRNLTSFGDWSTSGGFNCFKESPKVGCFTLVPGANVQP